MIRIMRLAMDALVAAPQFPFPACTQTGRFPAGDVMVFAVKRESTRDARRIIKHMYPVIPHGKASPSSYP
jgi:hypothetical protein